MTSELLSRRGAVAAAAPDEGVAAHYGEPAAEQRALERGTAIVDLSHLGVITVTGSDRLTWLHSITSQHLQTLQPGTSTELLVLDPHGRIEHTAAVIDDGTTAWLITEAGGGTALMGFLESMTFAMRVEVAARDDVAVIGTSAHGPDLSGLAPVLGQWADPWPVTPSESTRYGPPDHEHAGAQWQAALWLLPSDEVAGVVAAAEAAGSRLAGAWAWEAMRVATWRPRLAREVDERAIPHELDWLRSAVHLHKGCYRGQETIARVFALGRPPRRLVFVHLDGSEHTLPEPGTPVRSGEKDVGVLTSVVRHHELGPVGLALVKRSLDPEAELIIGGVAAAQEVVVGVEGFGTGRPPPRQAPKPNPALRRRPGN